MARTWLVVVTVLGLVGVLASGLAGQQRGDDVTRALAGAIDIHVHSTPDDRERSVDGLEAAIMARAHGLSAIVLKYHFDPTAGLA
jgi:hypothetical protein